MEQQEIENQDAAHVCTSKAERVKWVILSIATLVAGIVIGMFLMPHSHDVIQQRNPLTQQQRQQVSRAIPLNGQIVSISNTGAQSGTIQLRVSFDSVNNPTFQNPLPLPRASSAQSIKGIKTITVAFTKDTVFSTKKSSELKAGDYLSIRITDGNYTSGGPATALQIAYFSPITQIEQLVNGNGHTLLGKITAIKTSGASKIVTVSARIIDKTAFATTLEKKVSVRPYPHNLLRSDLSLTNKTYIVTVGSGTRVTPSAKLAVGMSVAVSGKEDIYTTNKITAVSLSVIPTSASAQVK